MIGFLSLDAGTKFEAGAILAGSIFLADGFGSVASGRFAGVEHNCEFVRYVGNWALGPSGRLE